MNQISENEFFGIKPENLTIQQFGKLYGPKATKTYSLLKSGEIRGVKIGRNTYIPRAEAERWSQNLPSFKPADDKAQAFDDISDEAKKIK